MATTFGRPTVTTTAVKPTAAAKATGASEGFKRRGTKTTTVSPVAAAKNAGAANVLKDRINEVAGIARKEVKHSAKLTAADRFVELVAAQLPSKFAWATKLPLVGKYIETAENKYRRGIITAGMTTILPTMIVTMTDNETVLNVCEVLIQSGARKGVNLVDTLAGSEIAKIMEAFSDIGVVENDTDKNL